MPAWGEAARAPPLCCCRACLALCVSPCKSPGSSSTRPVTGGAAGGLATVRSCKFVWHLSQTRTQAHTLLTNAVGSACLAVFSSSSREESRPEYSRSCRGSDQVAPWTCQLELRLASDACEEESAAANTTSPCPPPCAACRAGPAACAASSPRSRAWHCTKRACHSSWPRELLSIAWMLRQRAWHARHAHHGLKRRALLLNLRVRPADGHDRPLELIQTLLEQAL